MVDKKTVSKISPHFERRITYIVRRCKSYTLSQFITIFLVSLFVYFFVFPHSATLSQTKNQPFADLYITTYYKISVKYPIFYSSILSPGLITLSSSLGNIRSSAVPWPTLISLISS